MLYVWTGTAGLVALAELWLLADELFTVQHAKRAFSVVGAGAIIGGIFGGLATHYLAPRTGAREMLWIAGVELAIAAVLLRFAASIELLGRARAPSPTSPTESACYATVATCAPSRS